MLRLITISFSHYNDKARWALKRFGVPFQEEGYLPMFHFPAVIRAQRRSRSRGTKDRASTRFSTPVLVREDGDCICDSSRIVRYVSNRFASSPEEHLYPTAHAEEITRLETYFGDKLGPHSRRVAYHFAFSAPESLLGMARENVGRTQYLLFKLAFPLARIVMPRQLDLSPEKVARSEQRCRDIVAEVDAMLSDGRSYLVADRFTAADLAFASMLSPILVPSRKEGYGATFPELTQLPTGYRQLAEEMRATAAGKFALRMYAEERSTS